MTRANASHHEERPEINHKFHRQMAIDSSPNNAIQGQYGCQSIAKSEMYIYFKDINNYQHNIC
jgi:hypothetical protein